MKLVSLFLIFVTMISLSSCGKAPGKTGAKLKLNLGALVGIPNGIGDGGAILFGRNLTTGKSFGKKLTGSEENLDLENGQWAFYATMWDTSSSAMNGKVHCGKAVASLNGVDAMIPLNLTNSNCLDPEFSGGKKYADGNGLTRFADLFIEECDDIAAATGYKCGLDNQGSALSYRFVFKSYKRGPDGGLLFGDDSLVSSCQTAESINNNGLAVNFPSGNGNMVFVGSLEFFIGSPDCTVTSKGEHQIVFNSGLSGQLPADDKVGLSTESCPSASISMAGGAAIAKERCQNLLGTWSGSVCNSIPATITRFAAAAECTNALTADRAAIKHLVAIPRPLVCNRYLNQSAAIGDHPFAGGDGSLLRPYKICTEWQLNQVGETSSPTTYQAKSFTLLKDLDMNKTDFLGTYDRPACVGVASSLVKKHHNTNPLDKISNGGGCTTAYGTPGFSGVFNGNYKTISNMRIEAESVSQLGLVRRLHGGSIKNLFLKNVEVSGKNTVGAIAGYMSSPSGTVTPEIKNIWIKKGEVEGKSIAGAFGDYIGGAVGETQASFPADIKNIHLEEMAVKGRNYLGGVIGINYGTLSVAHFRGQVRGLEPVTGGFIGGLVGDNGAGSSIASSFSEGMIQSNIQYTGGIAGSNSGLIHNVYSTMAMSTQFTSSIAYAGGIVGRLQVSGAELGEAVFDGSLKFTGNGGTPTLRGAIGYKNAGTVNDCFFQAPLTDAYGTLKTYAQLRDGATSTALTAGNWQKGVGSIPRLIWESRECLLSDNHQAISYQRSTLSRGTLLSPFIICDAAQLSTLSSMAAGEYARLAEDVNLIAWTAGNFVSSFSGMLNGADRILYGADISTNGNGVGLFQLVTSTGKIKNLKLYNNSILNATGAISVPAETGLLVSTNQGSLSSIHLMENKVEGMDYVGMIAGKNLGLIDDSKIEGGVVTGSLKVGGVAGLSSGASARILRADVETLVNNLNVANSEYFGGIVGYNDASMDQVRFGGTLDTSLYNSGTTYLHAGGLAGYNTSTITNGLTDSYARIFTADNGMVGGLVGENAGTLSKSLSLARVLFSDSGTVIPGASTTFHSAVGGTGTEDLVYYLANNIGSYLGSLNVSNCTGAVSPFTCSVSSLTSSADAFTFIGTGYSITEPMNALTFLTSTTFSTNILIGNSQMIDIFKTQSLATSEMGDGGGKTPAELSTLATFCSSFSENSANGVCTTGLDIAEEESYGHNRLLAYYQSYFDGTATPSGSPIWELDSQDGHPNLLQLKR